MPNPTPELGLQQALDGDDAANYLDTSLANSLFTIDALFNNVSGHTHGDVHQGGPISAIPVSAIPDGSITSAKLTDGTIQTVDLGDGIVTTPKLGDGAVTTPKLAANITLTTPTLNSPTINTATETSPTISNPTISGTISGSPTFSNGPITSDWFRVAPTGQGIFNTATGGGIGFDTTGPFMYGAYSGGHLISETGTQTLSGKTLTAPQINNASETSPSISNPNISGNLLFDAASNSAAARIALPPTAGPKISLYDSGAGSFFGLGINNSELYLAVPASAGLELRQNNGSGAIMFGVTMATGKVQTNGPVSAQLFTAEGIASTGYGFETINSASPGGKGLANAWTTYSSERFKTDIRTMDDGVATLRRLRPVHYADKASGAPSIGLIAEEVAEVYPQLVDQDDDGETVSLDYGKLAAPILSALLEVIQRVEALEAHNDG